VINFLDACIHYGRTRTDLPRNRVSGHLHLRTRPFFGDQPTREHFAFTGSIAHLLRVMRLADAWL
jgi:hypothetical protein